MARHGTGANGPTRVVRFRLRALKLTRGEVMNSARTLPVTRRAIIARINRKLAPESRRLKKTRGMRFYQDLGDYWIVDHGRNAVDDTHVDVEALARELKVIHPREKITD
jgi:hypothetical protein